MPGRSDELNSWKDIASYLGVTVRTAQLWERERALPVHRLPGRRGRVYAYIEELEAWKSGGSNGESAAIAGAAVSAGAEIEAGAGVMKGAGAGKTAIQLSNWRGTPAPHVHYGLAATRSRVVVWGFLGFVAIAVLAAVGVAKFRRRPPAKYRLEPDALVIMDAGGRELWRKPLQKMWMGLQPYRSPVAFADVNGDSRTEVIFAQKMVEAGGIGYPLVCYSEGGAEIWRFIPGKQVRTGEETFVPPFDVDSFVVGRFGAERGERIVVISNHSLYYPAQIAMLSGDGRLLREYWHWGQLHWPLVVDINNDGKDEVVLTGVRNATNEVTVIALDPRTMHGAPVEENPHYQLLGFEPGNELRRITIPRSCIGKALGELPHPARVELTDKEIVVEIEETLQPPPDTATLYFHFNRDLSIRAAGCGTDFESLHEKMYGRGELDHRFSDSEIQDLRRRVH